MSATIESPNQLGSYRFISIGENDLAEIDPIHKAWRIFLVNNEETNRQEFLYALTPSLSEKALLLFQKRWDAIEGFAETQSAFARISGNGLDDGTGYFCSEELDGEALKRYIVRNGQLTRSEGMKLVAELLQSSVALNPSVSLNAFDPQNLVVRKDLSADASLCYVPFCPIRKTIPSPGRSNYFHHRSSLPRRSGIKR